jgi:hypothetical protein
VRDGKELHCALVQCSGQRRPFRLRGGALLDVEREFESRGFHLGLDARVYRSTKSLPPGVDARRLGFDSATGEMWILDGVNRPEIPAASFIAIERRLGNISSIGAVRKEIEAVNFARGSILLEKCLQSASHSGDVIEVGELDDLEREVSTALGLIASDAADARQFLLNMKELIEAAKSEQNPIVFV